jgi:hypothetical protein
MTPQAPSSSGANYRVVVYDNMQSSESNVAPTAIQCLIKDLSDTFGVKALGPQALCSDLLELLALLCLLLRQSVYFLGRRLPEWFWYVIILVQILPSISPRLHVPHSRSQKHIQSLQASRHSPLERGICPAECPRTTRPQKCALSCPAAPSWLWRTACQPRSPVARRASKPPAAACLTELVPAPQHADQLPPVPQHQ